MKYELFYWPGLQGRGEFVRLAFEEAGVPYVDIALVPGEGGGADAIMRVLDDPKLARPPFAPPWLRVGKQLISQTANILLYLGPRLGLAPPDAAGRTWAHQLQLTIADFVDEAHDTHHPVGSSLYYEEQKREARRATHFFLKDRVPKFLGYFEHVIERNRGRGPWMIGSSITYVDLSMAQVVAGLRYAFPKAMRGEMRKYPRLARLHRAVLARPRIRKYVKSGRQVPFNTTGIFRHYPELDRPVR
ncbi:MAG TPA: glutathione S-transferase [Usitatibacter sp.]|nr:glutathione S-transferase [Usitatibacter sp.]